MTQNSPLCGKTEHLITLQNTSQPVAGNTEHVCWKGDLPAPAVRNANELTSVLADPACACTGPVYSMYRDVARSSSDRQWLSEQEIRFDITVIPPRDLNGEYMKTKGHYHPENPSGTGYPEIYEVLEGNAHYLLQSKDLTDVVMIPAKAGDVVVIPPGYGHVTINPSQTTVLQMANLVSSAFQSDYKAYEDLRGAAFYEMNTGIFTKNPLYPPESRLRHVRKDQTASLENTTTNHLYELVELRAPVLGFLNHPEEFPVILEGQFQGYFFVQDICKGGTGRVHPKEYYC
jgi:glucose-6-phosphate isomerase